MSSRRELIIVDKNCMIKTLGGPDDKEKSCDTKSTVVTTSTS